MNWNANTVPVNSVESTCNLERNSMSGNLDGRDGGTISLVLGVLEGVLALMHGKPLVCDMIISPCASRCG